MSNGIAAALNAQYTAEAKPQTSPWFPRASGCGGCLREMAHRLAGFEGRPDSPESLRVFELGHQRGAALAAASKAVWPDAVTCNCGTTDWECKPGCASELQVGIPGLDRPMLGHLDLWIPSLSTIVDFKTAGGFKMGLLAAGEEGAGEDYEMQLQAYRHGVSLSYFTKFDGALSLPVEAIRCVLVFEAKDSDARKGVTAGQLVEVEVPHTPELEARFQARLASLAAMLHAHEVGLLDPKTVPGMPAKHWRCRTAKDGRPLYCSIGPTVGQCG